MAVFKFAVSNPKTRKSYNMEVEQDKAIGLIGKRIKDTFNGDLIGLSGYELMITGGTDKDGFPMNPSVRGPVRKKIVLSGPPGFHPKRKGARKRKTVRGDTVSKNIVQINCKVTKEGKKSLEDLLGKKPPEGEATEKPEKEEKPKEKKPEKAEKPKEEKPEKKEPEKKEEAEKKEVAPKKEEPKKEKKPEEKPKEKK
jgi:small subunit ribosomal protein S6e